MVDALASDASRRHMLRQAIRITLFMRHGANLLVCAVVFAIPPVPDNGIGRVYAAALGAWAAYRLATRATSSSLLAVDYVATLAACLATPALVSGAHFYLSNSAPVAIAGTAVISFTIATPQRPSLALTVGIAAAFAAGASMVVGWNHVGDIFNLYYFALQWVTAALIRAMVLRVADSVDTARADRVATELQQQVRAAVREYDREQMRLLHDTVASTLLTVGDGTSLAPQRIAAWAQRDLHVFDDTSPTTPARADLVAALRNNAEHVTTPITYAGATALWLDGAIAAGVAAAAREALTNVDRHAAATAVTITVEPGRLRIVDNGRGFNATRPSGRHGIAASITARMRGLGGEAIVTSQPGHGTTVELHWPTDAPVPAEPAADPERLIERTRAGYKLALTAYAIANLSAMMPTALHPAGHPQLQWALAATTALVTVSAITPIARTAATIPRLGVLTLLIVALVQSVTLSVDQLGTQAQWSQGVIGWCVLPLLLGERASTAAGILVSCWSIPATYALLRDPSAHTIVNLGYGTASILIVQLCALFFDNLIRQAAATAGAETDARTHLVLTEKIADAVQAEYRRRYADLANTIRPLLLELAGGGAIDTAARRQAHVEYQRLRALFDQSAAFDHVLMRELRPIVDSAQDRGVAVSVTIAGTLPAIDDAAAQRLAHAIRPALTAASEAARITASGRPTGIELSVTCRGIHDTQTFATRCANVEGQLEVTIVNDTVWITVRHQLTEGSPQYELASHAT